MHDSIEQVIFWMTNTSQNSSALRNFLRERLTLELTSYDKKENIFIA